MRPCVFCHGPVKLDDPKNYHQIISWVNGPKLDGPVMREHTGLVAHFACVDNLTRGQAADQPELFGDSDGEV